MNIILSVNVITKHLEIVIFYVIISLCLKHALFPHDKKFF
jgi:hypothetical protein